MHLLNPSYLMAVLLKAISLNRGKGQFHALSTLKIKTCNSAITISNGSKKKSLNNQKSGYKAITIFRTANFTTRTAKTEH